MATRVESRNSTASVGGVSSLAGRDTSPCSKPVMLRLGRIVVIQLGRT